MNHIAEWLPQLEHFRVLGYCFILMVTFLESVVVVGALVPGTTIVLLSGALAAQGYFDAATLVWFATAGAILGDGLSFWLGVHKTGWFNETSRFFKPCYLEAGKDFFQRHGAKSIFLGRFVGVVRMLVPFVAGLSRMEPRRFYFWNIVSGFAWSVSHVLAGYFLGEAWRSVEVWASRGGIILAALAAAALCAWLLRHAIVRKCEWLLAWLHPLWAAVKLTLVDNPRLAGFAARHPRLTSFARKRFAKNRFSGLPLTLLALALLCAMLLFGGAIEGVVASDRIAAVDAYLASLIYSNNGR